MARANVGLPVGNFTNLSGASPFSDVPGDYDGDGKTDWASFIMSQGVVHPHARCEHWLGTELGLRAIPVAGLRWRRQKTTCVLDGNTGGVCHSLDARAGLEYQLGWKGCNPVSAIIIGTKNPICRARSNTGAGTSTRSMSCMAWKCSMGWKGPFMFGRFRRDGCNDCAV